MLLNSATTDWLNTKPVYYNVKTGAISYSMTEVIDYSDFAFSPEGLRNYLKFGYSVFGQTMVENVRFLEANSSITQNPDGTLTITANPDPAEKLWNPGRENGDEVFEELISATKDWADNIASKDSEESEETNIILPLSGGLDSRLLAYAVRDRKNVYCYSYGLSANQRKSFETVKAAQVAKECNLQWECVELDEFLREDYMKKWYNLYGPTIHLHGMYQMEFYDKICDNFDECRGSSLQVLSGIIGDVWAGTVRVPEINTIDDLRYLGFTHGLCMDENVCLLPKRIDAAMEFYEKNRHKLKDESWCVIFTMRLKMQLLHYLLETPHSLGMGTWSPFIDPKYAMDILNLDWSLKTNRKWEYSAFDKLGLNIGWEKSKCDYNMVLDIETLRKNPVKPLNADLLGQVIKREYVEEVNRQIMRRPMKNLSAKPRTAANMYNKAVKKYNSKIDAALISYEILSPIERLLIQTSYYK